MNEDRGVFTFEEIISQPAVWAQTLGEFSRQAGELRRFWQAQNPAQVIFCGCGSTYYLSLSAAALFQTCTGIPARARPSSELLLFPEQVYVKQPTLLVAISRSGETTETVEAVRFFREQSRGQVLAITCVSRSSLAANADFVLSVDAAMERSIAQTRSFSSMTVLVQALAGMLAGEDVNRVLAPLPEALERLMQRTHPLAKQLGEDSHIERFFFLGGGFLYGIANEAMLKMKEMSLSYSEAFHPMEFRHGPMSMVNEASLVAGLVSEGAARQELAVLTQMRSLGGRLLALAEDDGGLEQAHLIRLPSGLPEWARAALYLPPLQLIAYYRALSRGQNPDRPHNLEAVIKL